jgi:hypothetical protein
VIRHIARSLLLVGSIPGRRELAWEVWRARAARRRRIRAAIRVPRLFMSWGISRLLIRLSRHGLRHARSGSGVGARDRRVALGILLLPLS